jgi:hypothetical protein
MRAMATARQATVAVAGGLVIAGTLAALAASGRTLSPEAPSWEPRTWPPVAASSRRGCDRVASPAGSDQNPGTVRAPYFSVQALAERIEPGQTGCLRAGTYTPSGSDYVLSIQRSGLRGKPIAIRSYPGERARLSGITQVEPRVRWVVLDSLDFEGDGSQNTIKIYGSDVTIEHSDITNRRRGLSCVILGNPEEGVAARPVLRANRLHDCGNPANGNKDHGIYAAYTVDGRITQNLFTNSAAYAIQFYPDAHRTRFERNVVDGGGLSIRGGVVFGGDTENASSHNLVAHNVIAYSAGYGVTSNWEGPQGTGNVVRKNCFWHSETDNVDDQVGFRARSNVVADPDFRDRGGGDYRMPSNNRCRRLLG